MKKKSILFLIFVMLLIPVNVFAANNIYSIDIDVDIDQSGNANITEVWDVRGSNGTEWYKVINGLGNSQLSDFTVTMDNTPLTYKEWNVDEGLSEKKGYFGINRTTSGLELCFGKYDYKRHKFTLNYTISNYVFNTSDSQVLYWNLIDSLSNVEFDDFSVTVHSYYDFPDTMDVWGYGYKGYAYVENGKIKMSNEGGMDDNYVVLLAKFPLNTFATDNSYSQFSEFSDVYDMAEEGTFEYDYDSNSGSGFIDFLGAVIAFIQSFFPIIIFAIIGVVASKSGYGYINNKKIDKKNTPLFRDIPCNKDIYYANALIKLNNFGYNESNIFGAIILKWVKNEKIIFRNEVKGIFNKETSSIDLTLNPTFDNDHEKALFDMMYEASGDGILETKELEKWCRKNYKDFFDLFKAIENSQVYKLKSEGHIYKRSDRHECKKKMVMDDKIYQDSIELYGMQKFLKEFSSINTKEVLEVHLWDEYLMFAYLFGMADKVAKQLKNMYPEVIEQSNIDFNTIMYVNMLSTRTVNAASSARSAAESYSAGGGGFSSGGGGGGSFGGGGGGSR